MKARNQRTPVKKHNINPVSKFWRIKYLISILVGVLDMGKDGIHKIGADDYV